MFQSLSQPLFRFQFEAISCMVMMHAIRAVNDDSVFACVGSPDPE